MKKITHISGTVFFDDGSSKDISLTLPATATDHDWCDIFGEIIEQATLIARSDQ